MFEAEQVNADHGAWSASSRSALLLDIIQGKYTAAEAGRRFGLAPDQIEAWARERLQANAEHVELECRYSAVFHGAGMAIWETDWSDVFKLVETMRLEAAGDLHGYLLADPARIRAIMARSRLTQINPAALRLFGIEEASQASSSYLRLRDVDLNLRVLAMLISSLAEGQHTVEAEGWLHTPDGREIEIVAKYSVLPSDRTWQRVFATALDVTERNENQRKLHQARIDLARASRVSLLGHLAAMIIHEVSQPLSAIMNFGESGLRWLAHGPAQVEPAVRCLKNVLLHSQRAEQVVADIRGLVARAAPRSAPMQLSDAVEEAVAMMQRELCDAAVVVALDSEPNLPPIHADRSQIQQVVKNLITNAVQAVAGLDEDRRRVQVDVRSQDGGAIVSVRDHGAGIDEAELNSVFEPFYTTKVEGMGMGLAVCRLIIEAHGGCIEAARAAGGGTVVSFRLPIGEAAA